MKWYIVLLLSLVASLVLVPVTLAAASNPIDSYVLTSSPGSNFGTSANLAVFGSGGVGVCTATGTAYLKWSLAGTAAAVGATTKLTVNVNFISSGADGNVSLYQVTDDSWTETGITANNAPAPGALLASVPLPGSTGLVTFTGADLAAYVNSQSSFVGGTDTTAGDDVISFAIRISGCTAPSSAISLDSREKTGGTAPALSLFDTNAVTLTGFGAADPTVNWPLIAGLGALALLIAAGGVIYRRRAAAHA